MDDVSPLYAAIAFLTTYVLFVVARISAIDYLFEKGQRGDPAADLSGLLNAVPERLLVSMFVVELALLFLIAGSLNDILGQIVPYYNNVFGYLLLVLIVPLYRGFARLLLPNSASYLVGSFTVPIFKTIDLLLYPLVSLYFFLLKAAGKLVKSERNTNAVTPDASLVAQQRSIGDIELEEDEREMIRGIYNIRDIIVKEIMVPRVDVVAAEDTTDIDELINLVVENGFSRIPIYHDQLDEMVGVLHAKDLFTLKRDKGKLSDFLRSPFFVPETKNISDLLDEFLTEKNQMAIVVDEYGGTEGLITLEDVIEEIVGEIHDEYDEEDIKWVRLSDYSFKVNAKADVTELNEALNLNIPDEEFESLGGYLISIAGHVPAKDEVFEENGITLKVLESDERRIISILLEITPTEDNEDKD
ncbi:MAG: HlyC/CorC family transporter [bacterium]|nr:HlyC/CorC family transporter [bacterium]